jgi:hypothetical protein
MKLDMKISPCCANLNKDYMLSINGKIYATQATYEHQKEDPDCLHVHHTILNCQYTSFLGFAKKKKFPNKKNFWFFKKKKKKKKKR